MPGRGPLAIVATFDVVSSIFQLMAARALTADLARSHELARPDASPPSFLPPPFRGASAAQAGSDNGRS